MHLIKFLFTEKDLILIAKVIMLLLLQQIRIQLIQLRVTSAIVKWQMCNMHERKKMKVII